MDRNLPPEVSKTTPPQNNTGNQVVDPFLPLHRDGGIKLTGLAQALGGCSPRDRRGLKTSGKHCFIFSTWKSLETEIL